MRKTEVAFEKGEFERKKLLFHVHCCVCMLACSTVFEKGGMRTENSIKKSCPSLGRLNRGFCMLEMARGLQKFNMMLLLAVVLWQTIQSAGTVGLKWAEIKKCSGDGLKCQRKLSIDLQIKSGKVCPLPLHVCLSVCVFVKTIPSGRVFIQPLLALY
eukprot:c18175_g1_i1 orf=138-608(-)